MIFGKTINKYYVRYLHLFILGIIALVIVDYVQLEIPGLTASIIDGVQMNTIDESGIFQVVMTIAIYAIIIIVGRFLWRVFIFGASRRVDYGIRNEMFSHSAKLSQRFYGENKVGGLMAYFTNDLEAVRRAVGPGMIMFVDALFLGGLAFYHMFNLDVQLTLFSGIPLIFIAIIGAILGNKMRIKFKEAQKAFEDLSDFTNENLSGIGVVKAFVKEQREIEEFLLSHPEIQDVQVFGVPDKKYGEEICAWIIPVGAKETTLDEVRSYCDGQIAHYKVPRYVKIVSEFPMTVTGKPQKFLMREAMAEELSLEQVQTA